MNSQNKIIGDILSLYDTILKNKNLSEASDIYDNVNFKDNIVPNGTPSKDNINLSLLQDIQTAAKSAGLNVDITTAISGHNSGGRHTPGNAVDIAIINNKSVNKGNTADADKLTATLEKMGYVRNSEGSNVKSVLWKMPDGTHYDHVHISNIGKSSSPTPTETSDDDTTNNNKDDSDASFAKEIGKSLLNAVGIKESVNSDYEIILQKKNHPIIKSPVDGTIVDAVSKSICENRLTINVKYEKFYLEYCGLKTTNHKIGDRVNEKDILGFPQSDIKIRKYNENGVLLKIKNKDDDNNTDPQNKEYENKKFKNTITGDNVYSQLLLKGYEKFRNSFKKDEPKKLKENINRIKGLLK